MNHRSIALALALLLIGGCQSGSSDATTAQRSAHPPAPKSGIRTISELLPPGRYKAEVIDAKPSPRQSELTYRLLAAQAENPEWFQSYLQEFVKQGKSGPLPYDKRFGLSRAEYEEYLNLPVELAVVNDFPLEIKNEEGAIRFRTGPMLWKYLERLVIDPDHQALTTPIARIDKSTVMDSTVRQFGSWRGYTWHDESGDMKKLTGQSVTLSIGFVAQTGHTLVEYRLNVIDRGTPVQSERVLFRFRPN